MRRPFHSMHGDMQERAGRARSGSIRKSSNMLDGSGITRTAGVSPAVQPVSWTESCS